MGYHYFVIIFFVVICCKPQNKEVVITKKVSPCLSFSLKEPIEYDLPFALKEISGLTYSSQLDQWITINDEKGTLYFLDNNFELISTVPFGPSGDYEGIEIVGNIIYVINSKGDIHRYNYKSESKLDPLKTKLSLKNDVEGLGYHPELKALIIACKGNPYIKKKKKSNKKKALYLFDLKTKEFIEEPFMFIDDVELLSFIEDKNGELDKKCKTQIQHFAPSGVTFNNGLFYVLSSTAKCIVVLDHNQTIKQIHMLDKYHNQPEGIFIKNEYLYISNEAKGLVSNLYQHPLE